MKLSQGSLHLVMAQKRVSFQFYLLRAALLEICLRAAASAADEANVVTPVDGESKCGYFPEKQQLPLADAVSEIDGPAERCEKLQVSSFFILSIREAILHDQVWDTLTLRQLSVTHPHPPTSSVHFAE